jgi:hypothetical protein
MAQPWATGPVHIFTGTAGGNTGPNASAEYFGTGERAPNIRIRRGWSPVFNDLSGTEVPFDMMYESQEAFVTVTMTRWNEPCFQRLSSMPNPATANAFGGVFLDNPGDIGSLMLTEGLAFQLWLQFPYASKTSYGANNVLPPGLHFYSAWFEGPDEWEVGTTSNKRLCVFHAVPQFFLPSGQFILGDYNMSALPGIN